MLALADGVLAVGVGERTRPAGAERLARAAVRRGLAHTVLAVPIEQDRATMHLDTICTMVDVDAMVMYPNVAAPAVGLVTVIVPEAWTATMNATRTGRSRSSRRPPRRWASTGCG